MKILLISGSFPLTRCGVGDYSALLALALAKQVNVEVGVLTTNAPNLVETHDEVDLLPLVEDWGWKCIQNIKNIIKDWQPDIIHIQYPTRGYGSSIFPYWLPLTLRTLRIPIVQTWHEPLIPRRALLRYFLAALLPDHLVVVEPGYKSMLPGWFNWIIRRKKFYTIPVASSIPRVILTENERDAIKGQFDSIGKNLIVHFGNPKPSKGIETIFNMADPTLDRIVIIGQIDAVDLYHQCIAELLNSERWRGKSFATGFLAPELVGRLLAAADAAVYPFKEGLSQRNTSFLAAKNQGTFTLTFSRNRHGYDSVENVYYASVGNIGEMQQALRIYAGRKIERKEDVGDWDVVVESHLMLYKEALEVYQG